MVNKLLTQPLIIVIRFYQYFLSPLLGQNCRYLPTCSEYSIESFRQFGIIKGFILSFKRISKCHPWGNHEYDPVPKKIEKKL